MNTKILNKLEFDIKMALYRRAQTSSEKIEDELWEVIGYIVCSRYGLPYRVSFEEVISKIRKIMREIEK